MPFRETIDIAGAGEEMEINAAAAVKELRFDMINEKQVDIRGSILASAEVMETKELKLMKNLCLLETEQPDKKALQWCCILPKKATACGILPKIQNHR